MADVKSRDVPDSWLLFGRVKIMVGDAADVPSETFHGFVVIVGGSWPCGTEFETHAQEGLSSVGNRCFFAKVVERSVGRASNKINGRHSTVIIL